MRHYLIVKWNKCARSVLWCVILRNFSRVSPTSWYDFDQISDENCRYGQRSYWRIPTQMFIILCASYLKDCVYPTKCTFDDKIDIHSFIVLWNHFNIIYYSDQRSIYLRIVSYQKYHKTNIHNLQCMKYCTHWRKTNERVGVQTWFK